MHRCFAIFILITAASLGSIAAAQIRDSVQPTASSGGFSSGPGHSHSTSAQASAPEQASRTRGGTGIVDRIIFPRQGSGYNVYRGNARYSSAYYGNPTYYGYGYRYSTAVVAPISTYSTDGPSPYTTYYGNEAAPAAETSNIAMELAYRQGMLDQKVRSLGEELARMRAEKAAQEAEAAARVLDADTSDPPTSPKALPDTITIVYLDGRHQDITNYAFVGQTLWVLDEKRSFRVPLSEIDLPATRKLNIERGVEFVLPAAR